MNGSTLKFSFCVSLLVHGVLFSTAYFLYHPGYTRLSLSEPPQVLIVSPEPRRMRIDVQSAHTIPATPRRPSPPKPSPPPPQIEAPRSPHRTDLEAFVLHPVPIVECLHSAEASLEPIPVAETGTARSMVTASSDHAAGPGYLYNPKPVYPEEARERRQEGVVVVAVFISKEGRVERAELASSSGFALLDDAALTAVRRWRFTPAKAGDIPIPSRVEVPIRFTLAFEFHKSKK